MTEEEAREKWCPHVVASHTDPRQSPSQYERDAGATSPFRHNCIASACMAWRWLPAPEVQSKLVAIRDYREQHNTDLVTAKNAVEAAWTKPVATDGFCGLAGAPQ